MEPINPGPVHDDHTDMTSTGHSLQPSQLLRAVLALLLGIGVVAGVASPAAADDHHDDDDDDEGRPVLMEQDLAAVMAGTTSWVNLVWVADGDIDGVKVTAEGKDGVTVGYSPTTGEHAGPMQGYAMADRSIDTTALRITVPEDTKKKDVKLKVEVTWSYADGRRSDRDKVSIKIPIVHHSGADWEQVDTTASLDWATDNGWVDVRVAGLAPRNDDMQMWLVDDAGLDVYLPQDDSQWSGPEHDALLERNETDAIRFYIEPGTPAGTYPMEFRMTWTSGDEAKEQPVSFELTIT